MLQRYDFLLNDVHLYAKKCNKYLIFNNHSVKNY